MLKSETHLRPAAAPAAVLPSPAIPPPRRFALRLTAAFLPLAAVLLYTGVTSVQLYRSAARREGLMARSRERIETLGRLEHSIGTVSALCLAFVANEGRVPASSALMQQTVATANRLLVLTDTDPVEAADCRQLVAIVQRRARVGQRLLQLPAGPDFLAEVNQIWRQSTPDESQLGHVLTGRIRRLEINHLAELHAHNYRDLDRLFSVMLRGGIIAVLAMIWAIFVIRQALAMLALSARQASEARGELARLNDSLEQRVAERTSELRQTVEEVELFAYTVSHDLRTPLRALTSFATMLSRHYGSRLDSRGLDWLQEIIAGGQRAGEQVDALLHYSQMGRRQPARGEVSTAAIVRDLLDTNLASEIHGRQVEIAVGPLPPTHGDPLLVQHIFVNLLGNALKFTRQQPAAKIEVGALPSDPARPPDQGPIYYVRDNGVGFDMKYAGKLFKVFERLHSGQEYEGLGIGLALVKRLAELQGGRVWCEAQPDRGATFYFTLG